MIKCLKLMAGLCLVCLISTLCAWALVKATQPIVVKIDPKTLQYYCQEI